MGGQRLRAAKTCLLIGGYCIVGKRFVSSIFFLAGLLLIVVGLVFVAMPFLAKLMPSIEKLPPIILWVYKKDGFYFATSPLLIIISLISLLAYFLRMRFG